jgi:hypothetical protein
MRILTAALIALATLALAVPPAEARSRSQTAHTQATARNVAPQTARAATTRRDAAPRREATSPSRAPAARQATARVSRPANARGSRHAARTGGRQQTRRGAVAPRPVSWQAGLAPATNAQAQSCPAGTLATLARGHADVVRCLPL